MATRTSTRKPLTRERILRAAIRMADAQGLDSLTMRKLGHELGVEAMSLYNHVANKDDLLNGMVDTVVGEMTLPAADEEWEATIRASVISAHETLLRHRWACNLMMSPGHVTRARIRYMDALLGRLRTAGFSPETTYRAYHAVDSHVFGFTLWQIGHASGATGLTQEFAERFLESLGGDFPYLLEHARQHFDPELRDGESEFEFGLDLILDGLKRMRA